MTITAELVGTLGGGQMTQTPVSGSQTGTSWKTIHTVTVPAGETWLVSMTGTMRASGFSGATAYLSFTGSLPVRTNSTQDMDCGASVRVAGPASVSLSVRGESQFDSSMVSGTVYTTPLEA